MVLNPRDRPQEVRIDPAGVYGFLAVPQAARGLVLFAHGSGSGRRSPRNGYVAQKLHEAEIATLLLDLLTEEEADDRRNIFDIALLAERLALATDWVGRQRGVHGLPIGYFGASTGAGAALLAAAGRADVAAVVSRGGRPDLACEALAEVRAPTLLIVGSRDTSVLQLNQAAMAQMRCEVELAVVPGATHLFEETGALDAVIRLARGWFLDHFTKPPAQEASYDRHPAGLR